MKSRSALFVVGLVALLAMGGAGCGGDDVPPDTQNPGPNHQAPGAPTELTVTPGDGQVLISWKAPADDGGAPVTRYNVRALQAGTALKTETTTQTSITISGLTNGTEYTFTVTATNSVGDGAGSSPSAAVRPRKALGVPRDVAATPADTQVTVTWSAPEETGLPVTGYTVTVRDGDTVVSTTETTETTFVATGLTNGTSYTFVITATNAGGQGTPSGPVAARPRTLPGAPHLFRTRGGEREITLYWQAPTNDGGSPITGYRAVLETVDSDEKFEFVVSAALEPGLDYYIFNATGLADGERHNVVVHAINEAGEGPASNTVLNTTLTRPTAPRDFTAAVQHVGRREVRLSWNWPASAGGSLLRGCRFTAQPGNRTWEVEYDQSPTPFYVDIVTFDGTTYTYTLACFNTIGEGPSVTAQVTAPAP